MTGASLNGLAVLVIEDEYLIAEDMRRELERDGALVVGPAPSAAKALRLIDVTPRIDLAILDVNLGGEKSFPVAEALRAKHIPFVFATGYSAADIPSEWRHVSRMDKPLRLEALPDLLTSDRLGDS